MGRPWEIGKAFEQSAPCDEFFLFKNRGIIDKTNNIAKQSADISQMICSVPKMISISSDYFELAARDVSMIGTPVGVNSVQSGDVMLAFIE